MASTYFLIAFCSKAKSEKIAFKQDAERPYNGGVLLEDIR